ITLPTVRDGAEHTFHLYVIQAQQRDALKDYLSRNGIETSIHYPTPLPFLQCYEHLQHTRADFPVVATNQHRILSLPMFPELTASEINYVSDKIKAFYATDPASRVIH